MTTHHEIIQFDSAPETAISAFQLFQLKIDLVHAFNPSEIYFTAYLQNANELFPDCYQLLHQSEHVDCRDTLLPLATQNGKFPVPSYIRIPV